MMLNIRWCNFKNLISSKAISILLSLSLILTSFIFAFADDSAADPVQGSAPELTAEENEFLSNASDEHDLIIRQAVVQAVRSTSSSITLDNLYDLLFACITNVHGRYEWCVTDQTLYNLINNNFSHYDSNSGNTYDTGAMLWIALTHLSNLNNDFTPALSSNPTMYELTADLNDTLNAFWLAFQAFASAQVNYTSALWYNNIGVAQYAYQTNQTTANVFTMLNNVLRPLISNIDTNISFLKTNSDTLISNTNTISNTLTSIQNDFNNINWSTFDNSFLGIKKSLSDEDYLTVGAFSSSTIYAFFTNNNILTYNNIYRFDIPIRQNSSYQRFNLTNFVIYFYDGTTILDYSYYYVDYSHNSSISIYIANLDMPRSGNIILSFSNSNTKNFRVTDSPGGLYYISDNNIDFYYVYGYLANNSQIEYYQLWKELYASDDIIAAKEAQQPLEDSVLEDFTGSGSASASVGNAIDIKGVQSSIKGSLNTGDVNASGLSTILNTSSPTSNTSFFTFWTQSCADDINGTDLITPTRTIYYHLEDGTTLTELVEVSTW